MAAGFFNALHNLGDLLREFPVDVNILNPVKKENISWLLGFI